MQNLTPRTLAFLGARKGSTASVTKRCRRSARARGVMAGPSRARVAAELTR